MLPSTASRRILRGTDPRDKAEVYSRIGLRMTYEPGPEMIKAEVVSNDLGRVLDVCPRPDVDLRYASMFVRKLMID